MKGKLEKVVKTNPLTRPSAIPGVELVFPNKRQAEYFDDACRKIDAYKNRNLRSFRKCR